jgi:hypothetical protein
LLVITPSLASAGESKFRGFVIPDRKLVPEGLAYDDRTQCFLMGSLNEKKIIRYAKDGTVGESVPAGRDCLAEVLGIRMDPWDGRVWVASGLDAQHSAVFHFDPSGGFIKKYPPPERKSDHLFNDLVVCRKTKPELLAKVCRGK